MHLSSAVRTGTGLLIAALWVWVSVQPALAQACDKAAFEAVVAETGGAISAMNAENKKLFQDKLQKLKVQAGWPEADYVANATPYVKDERTAELDAANQTLLARVQSLSDAATADKACDALASLRAAMDEMVQNTRAKWEHMLAKVTQASAPGPVHAGAAPR
jgi:hypothetical protein